MGSCRLILRLDQAESLKDRRRVVRSLVDRMRQKFNVSVAEVGDCQDHRQVVLGITCVANRHAQVRSVLDTVSSWVDAHFSGELLVKEIELF